MAISLNRVTTKMLKNLTLENVMCPVCRGIFIEPVTMPCQHGLCLQCFERSVEETSFSCPMCRKRIGSWLRTKKKEQNLVNLELWSFIQKRFPQQVQAKLNGEDDGVEQIVCRVETPRFSSAGEIKEEFQLHLQKLENEVKKKQEEEQKASEELIRKIQEEEEKQLQSMREQLFNQSVEDEKIAKELQESEALEAESSFLHCSQNKQSHTTAVKGPMDAFVFAHEKKPFALQQNTSKKAADCILIEDAEKTRTTSVCSTGSHDSIKPEMHHFKPIRSVPRTPPKKLPDGRLLVPKVVRPKTLNWSPVYESHSRPSNPMQSFRGSSALRLQLERIQADRLRSRSRSSDIVSAFKGRLNRVVQQPTFIFGSHIGMRESASEDIESPRKKPRKDFMTEEEESRAIPSSSSSSDQYCRDEKVVVLVHNPEEGSESQSQDMSSSSRKDDHSSISTDEDDTDLEAPEVALEIGVEAERSNSDVLMASVSDHCKPTATSSASSGFNLKMDQLTLNNRVNESPKNNLIHTLGINIKQKGNNINNMVMCKSPKDKSRFVEDPDAIAMQDEEPLVCITAEQARIEQMLLQERADLELALRLQEQWDIEARTVDRSKGSLLAYELRNSKPSKRSSASASRKKLTAPVGIGRSRQSTLEESFCLQRSTRR